MIDEEVGAVILAIVVVASVFGIAEYINSNRVVEPFSAIGLLGPKMKIGDYPTTVVKGERFKLYIYVANHEGKAMYYRILVKLGNRSTFINSTMPAKALVIVKFERILLNNQTWIQPLELAINKTGIDYRLIVEMWIYNTTSHEFNYYGRWVHLWINVTG